MILVEVKTKANTVDFDVDEPIYKAIQCVYSQDGKDCMLILDLMDGKTLTKNTDKIKDLKDVDRIKYGDFDKVYDAIINKKGTPK